MDWAKAKNYTIIFLIGLNLFLFICNLIFNKRYVITDRQIEAITSILEQKNIKLESEIPLYYDPMTQISFDDYVYDFINLQEIFFGGTSNVKRTSDFEKTVLSFNNQKITITNDVVEFFNPKIDIPDFNTESVLKISEKYIDKISYFYDGLKFYEMNFNNDFCSIEYLQEYNNLWVFNNCVKFKIYKNGSFSVKLKYFPVKNMYGQPVDICSADEALFIFLDKAEELLLSNSLTIKRIEKGYYFDNFEKGSRILSAPYYRIEINEREKPFFINAYNRRIYE